MGKNWDTLQGWFQGKDAEVLNLLRLTLKSATYDMEIENTVDVNWSNSHTSTMPKNMIIKKPMPLHCQRQVLAKKKSES